MNCIGGFLLNYTNSSRSSEKIFSFLIEKRLLKFFENDFAKINKIIYVSEEVLYKYNNKFLIILQNHSITSDFYMSPIFLTIYTCSL